MDEIDLSDLIQQAHELDRYDAGTAFLIEQYGGEVNEHGVYQEQEEVQIARAGKSYAEVRLARTARGLWLYGHDFSSPTWMQSGPVSVWSITGYATREGAIGACTQQAIRFFEAVARATDSCTSESAKREARQIIAALSPSEPSPQMSLFDTLAHPSTTVPLAEP